MSIRAQVMSFLMRRTIKTQLANMGDDVDAFRQRLRDAGRLRPKIPGDVIIEPLNISGIGAEWVSLDRSDAQRVLLYFHGGGYVIGGLDGYREIAWRLAKASGIKVLLVED